jgi:hypothetical protein
MLLADVVREWLGGPNIKTVRSALFLDASSLFAPDCLSSSRQMRRAQTIGVQGSQGGLEISLTVIRLQTRNARTAAAAPLRKDFAECRPAQATDELAGDAAQAAEEVVGGHACCPALFRVAVGVCSRVLVRQSGEMQRLTSEPCARRSAAKKLSHCSLPIAFVTLKTRASTTMGMKEMLNLRMPTKRSTIHPAGY